ncbi:MAG: amidohydrolase, partial [Chloroflexi bacterium]|nr:amidohydrolase [Chloroflexota bacterium]
MELRHGLISIDDHVQEPPDLWTSRLDAGRWGERIPHIERAADGTERWVADGATLMG